MIGSVGESRSIPRINKHCRTGEGSQEQINVVGYFYCCWQLGEPAKILHLYPKIQEGAWRNPYIFHHTACAFVAAGDLDGAAREVHRALVYGYERVDDLLADPDIAALSRSEVFQSLKAYREQSREQGRPLRPAELLRKPEVLRKHGLMPAGRAAPRL